MNRSFESHSEEETMEFAARFGLECGPGDIVCLHGDLGAGKTHFVKGFVRAFGLKPEVVSSPTFALIHEYHGNIPVYHFDCYRLKSVEEALEIGAEEYFYGEGVSIIEWPDRISAILPEDVIDIVITSTGKYARQITINQKEEV